jgi:molybdopterin-guanine dinucleotide biosynthesis protein A
MGGGDKCLRQLGQQTVLSHVCNGFRPQVVRAILSANGSPDRFADCGLSVVADRPGIIEGPLAGLLAAMEWAAEHDPAVTHIASVAADTPFFPNDLVARLDAACEGSSCTVAIATSAGHTHWIFGLWPVALRPDLIRWATETDDPKVMAWAQRHPLAKVSFPLERLPDGRELDPFFNINTPDDLALATSLMAASAR